MEKLFAPFLTGIFRDQGGVCAFYPPLFGGKGYLIRSTDKVAQLKKIYAVWFLLIPLDVVIALGTFIVITTQPDYQNAHILAVVVPLIIVIGLFNFGYVTQKRVKALIANSPVIDQPPTVN